jgi:2'-5' RNA ligase
MRDYPAVGDLAQQAHDRLGSFTGLHVTPLEWLHMTALVAGPIEQFTLPQIKQMAASAAACLAGTPPITVSLGKILYHPEAIMLAVTPAEALAPIRAAALTATREITGSGSGDDGQWTPHVTLCYSTARQAAEPIIDALGMQLPERQIQVSAVSLVIQNGPERDWRWTVASTVRLGTPVVT